MPWTNYPGGISVTTTTGSVDGQIYATTGSVTSNFSVGGTLTAGTGSVTGALTVGGAFSFSTAATMVGERAYITFTFTSAASTQYLPIPFNGNIVDCWTTSDTTPRTVSGFTLQAGTAGTVYVATVATLVFATAAGQQHQPALTPAAITTASALCLIVTTAASAANFSATVVLQRTA